MLHVLLIEDSPADMQMVREAIRTNSVTSDLIIAHDGEEVLRFITEFHFKPDMFFLDLNVPKFNSFEFLEYLRANQGPPVVVLTGSANPEDKQRSLESGATEYIVKPSNIDEFMEVVREAVGRWGRQAAARGL
jgi:chemotaxis family two-component system response regulator Rcp1